MFGYNLSAQVGHQTVRISVELSGIPAAYAIYEAYRSDIRHYIVLPAAWHETEVNEIMSKLGWLDIFPKRRRLTPQEVAQLPV